MSVTMVTVVHTMTRIDETVPENMEVTVRPVSRLWVPADKASYLPRNISVPVSPSGEYTFQVPAADDPKLIGLDLAYYVTEYAGPVVPRGERQAAQTVHRIAPLVADAPGPVGLFETLVDAPVPGGAEHFVDRIVDLVTDGLGPEFASTLTDAKAYTDQEVAGLDIGATEGYADTQAASALTDAKGYTDQEVATRAPTVHTHVLTDLTDSTEFGRTLASVEDAGAGRDALDITVDTSVGTRVMVGGVMVHGDTGWRDISSLLGPNFILSSSAGRFRIKREGNRASLSGRLAAAEVLDGVRRIRSATILPEVPSGFGQARSEGYGVYGTGTAANEWVTINALFDTNRIDTGHGGGDWATGDLVVFTATWDTEADWPTALPGIPA